MSAYAGVPGMVETREAHGETTLVVDPARLVEACTHLRDEEEFNFLAKPFSLKQLVEAVKQAVAE